MTPEAMGGREATQDERWRIGTRFVIRKREYKLARYGGTLSADWTSWFCWAVKDGQVQAGEREIRIPDRAKIIILEWGDPNHGVRSERIL